MSRWEPSCRSGKRRYGDLAEAREALAAVRRRHKRRTEESAYRCPDCGGWHLTSSRHKPTQREESRRA